MDEGTLSEEANDYLAEVLMKKDGIIAYASPLVKQLAIDNAKFTKILDKLRDAYNNNPEQAQQEYLLFRSFLIQNQYASPSEIRKTLSIYL